MRLILTVIAASLIAGLVTAAPQPTPQPDVKALQSQVAALTAQVAALNTRTQLLSRAFVKCQQQRNMAQDQAVTDFMNTP